MIFYGSINYDPKKIAMLELQYGVDEVKFDDAYLNFLQNTTRTKRFTNIVGHRYIEDRRAYYKTPGYPIFTIWMMWNQ